MAVKQYAYEDSNWPDLLTSYNGEEISYDEIGNPIDYRDSMSFSWISGRNLLSVSFSKGSYNGESVYYAYDADNYRCQKSTNLKKTYYTYIDGTLLIEDDGTEHKTYMYDDNGNIFGVKITSGNETTYYYYQLNIQGDVIGIFDADGILVASYTYDDWGKVLSIEGSDANGIGKKNPIRYRGYYCDEETGVYYLGSRYYDPEVGRFLNVDDTTVLDAGYENINQYNLFTYCFNNPINMCDETGTWHSWATKIVVGTVATIAVTITVATGGAATPLLLGVVASTLSGATMGYITGGKEGAIEGAADGFMWGGIGTLASSTVSTIKALNIAKKGVTIGEDMASVRNAATLNNTATYKSMKGYNVVKKIFSQNVADKLSIYHNKVFIRRMRKLGAVIFDNGPRWSKNATSKWYIMEKQVLKGYSGLIKMY